MNDQLVRLQLEFDSRSPTPLGRLVTPDGSVIAFASWLELLTALQAVVHEPEAENARGRVPATMDPLDCSDP